MIMGAIEAALKKIGVDPQEEVNGTTKIFIATKAFLEVVGGIQFYLPKADSLSRIIKKANIYADSYVMSPAELAIKYGESGKSIYTTIKHVGAVIGNHEQS
ncbi:Mor transcription activator family protein [Escherichia coli]